MKMKKIINVTKDHIKRGKRRNCMECPIALAMCDVFQIKPTRGLITVHYDGINLCGKSIQDADLGHSAELFDRNGTIGPFSFTIEIDETDEAFNLFAPEDKESKDET